MMESNQESDIIPFSTGYYVLCVLRNALITYMQGYSVPNKFIAAQGKYILIMNLYAALNQWITIQSIHGSLADCR